MDKFGYPLNRGNETVSLFYPLGLRFFSRGSTVCSETRDDNEMSLVSSYVRLYGLTPDTIRLDDIECENKDAHGRVILRHVTIRIPCTFNLYVLIPVENEPLNVEFVERLVSRFMIDRIFLLKNRRERSRVSTGGFRERDRNQNPASRNQDYLLDSPKLELVLENLFRGVSSLYDIFDVLQKRGAFETETCTDRLSDVDILVNSNLYVFRFHDARLFSAVWKHLVENAPHWSSVFSIPASLDDECVRFSLDMLLEKRDRDLAEQQEEKSSKNNKNDSNLETVHRRRGRVIGESAEELVLSCPNFDEEISSVFQTEALSTANSTSGIDLYDAFALGSWCLTRLSNSQSRLLIRIDRSIFDRVCDSMTDLCKALSSLPNQRDKLFSSPLAFLPNVIWDIETIAARPGTLPRGTAADEALVSIAISVERNSLLPDGTSFSLKRVHSLTFLLLPSCAACDITEIQSLRLLDSDVAQPHIVCYRDERALLLDFCAYMSSQFPLLRLLFGIRTDCLNSYRNLASFLVGHNSIGYDFSFIVNRCLFYGLVPIARHLSRNIRNESNDICCMYNFCDAQVTVDTLLFLMARVRSLSSFDLASVLRVYDCDIKKGGLDARAIRFFYNSLGDTTALKRLGLESAQQQTIYLRDLLVYNLYDCLSLSSFLLKLSFSVFVDTLLSYFRSAFDVACYCGNSRLLPALFVSDLLRNGREVLCLRSANLALFSIDSQIPRVASLFQELHELLSRLGKERLIGTFFVHAFHGIDLDYNLSRLHESVLDEDTPPYKRRRVQRVNDPFTRMLLSYTRTLEAAVETTNESNEPVLAECSSANVRWLDLSERPSFEQACARVVASEAESELLRVHEKTYIGGLNFARASHIRDPVLMDYNSFYPSIIRHYELDVNNVAVVTVLKLLLLIRPLSKLRELIEHRVLRIFDYTPEHSVEVYVNLDVFRSARFSDIFVPAPFARRDWYEGIELDNVELLVASSKLLSRRLLVVWRKESGSAVSRLVSAALERRAVWKKQRRLSPNDKMLESRELMEKLLANGTYGYLNFKRSVIFSRATAAAVTLLCRNAFARTRYILESEELLERFDSRLAKQFKVDVNYIDTDGCIVSLRRVVTNNSSTLLSSKESAASSQPCGKTLQTKLASDTEQHVIESDTKPNVSSNICLNASKSHDTLLDTFSTNLPNISKTTRGLVGFKLTENSDTIGIEVSPGKSICVSRSLLLFPEPMSKNISLEDYLRIVTERKTRFADLVNEMLGMRHVVLAAEEQNAIAATIFGRKKYALLKLVSRPVPRLSCSDCFAMKKTGFEKNAPTPIKRIYDTLFKNVMLLNHTSGLVHSERFVCKILDHRAILYCIFDSLLLEWRRAINEDTLNSFSTRVPLNPKQTGGKLSEFIERTLREHQYNQGDRVSVLRLLRIDDRSLTTLPRIHDASGVPVIIYDTTDSEFVLLDEARGHINDYMLDLRLFLGGHLTYLYQCIEGQQTLRDGQLETVATNHQSCLKMRTLRGITMLFYSTWLWDRVLALRHRQTFGTQSLNFYALNWRGTDIRTTLTRLQRELMCFNLAHVLNSESENPENNSQALLDKVFPNDLRQHMQNNEFLAPPPLLFYDCFAKKWLHFEEHSLNFTRDSLFSWTDLDEERLERYKGFRSSGVLSYQILDDCD